MKSKEKNAQTFWLTCAAITITSIIIPFLLSYALFAALIVYPDSNYLNLVEVSIDEEHSTVEQDFVISTRGDKQDEQKNYCVWPEDCDQNDRILDQLKLTQASEKYFNILPPAGHFFPDGQELFLQEECNVNKCMITYDIDTADALVFQNSDVLVHMNQSKRKDQVWIAYFLESPPHTFDRRFDRLHRGKHEFNWTASYRHDSDLVTPYAKFVPFNDKLREYENLIINDNFHNDKQMKKSFYEQSTEKHKKLIQQKRGKVAWFASNCNAANDRLEYAKELSKYIQVDIYGKCGKFTCDKWNQTNCATMLNKEYKFYLSFENSNCRHYITEKLFINAYGYNQPDYLLVPIVMGSPQTDYELIAPPKSFIHVDQFKSAQELAKYLLYLDLNDPDYYAYFYWKTMGNFIDTKFFCRICALLHEAAITGKTKSYSNIKSWWNHYPFQNQTEACKY